MRAQRQRDLGERNHDRVVLGQLEAQQVVRRGVVILAALDQIQAARVGGRDLAAPVAQEHPEVVGALADEAVAFVTKDGAVAGPRTLEHLVDVVLHFADGSGIDGFVLFTNDPAQLGEDTLLMHRLGKDYVKPAFGITSVAVNGSEVAIFESIASDRAFCELRHFKRLTDNTKMLATLQKQPTVLVVAPLSGHHSTLLRDTVRNSNATPRNTSASNITITGR